jgi:FtsH-binding integral membrane protein
MSWGDNARLVALIGVGVLGIVVSIPAGAVVYALAGLVVFAGLVMLDFQRLRASSDLDSAPLLAASIFLDILNVFEFLPLPVRQVPPVTAQTARSSVRNAMGE